MASSWGSLPSRTSPKGGQRGCLCKDGKRYSIKCCNGSLHAQGIGVIDGVVSPIIPVFPSNTILPVISGATALGSVLSSTTGTWTGIPTPTFAYQWKRGITNITSATNSTYTLVVGDSAQNITCVVTATNTLGSANATSNIITAQTYSAPANTIAPVISGTTTLGSLLSSTTGTWTGNPLPTFSYQWTRNGLPIINANLSTYSLILADSLANIQCLIIATNALGSDLAPSNIITANDFTLITNRITEINDQRITENNNNRITQ
jgi:hypothetical protein